MELTREFLCCFTAFSVLYITFFLPHMHERYAILVDVMAIVYVFFDFRKLYIPVLTILCSFAGYTVYLEQNNIIPMYVYTILFLLLMLDHARACVKGMQDGKIAVGE